MVHTDSSAALDISHRRGLGKTRHIHVQCLRVQEKVKNKELTVSKIGTHENPADVLTKGFKADVMARHLQADICRPLAHGCQRRGRPRISQ